ncbi:hypothetical protein Pth03_61320 [Planotetraspora thailandica]|uniref:Uncharacterized protein n=1 Tax=Planotetraspora thailandica TaxID=487172 RepID=A0A8J3V6T1_9ACTN|nr:hypothetical protein Pth03_61320 [Planotetraspora thailandica]
MTCDFIRTTEFPRGIPVDAWRFYAKCQIRQSSGAYGRPDSWRCRPSRNDDASTAATAKQAPPTTSVG